MTTPVFTIPPTPYSAHQSITRVRSGQDESAGDDMNCDHGRQLAMVAARAREFFDERAKKRQLKAASKAGKVSGAARRGETNVPAMFPERSPGDARDEAGEAFGVSGSSSPRVLSNAPIDPIHRPKHVLRQPSPKTIPRHLPGDERRLRTDALERVVGHGSYEREVAPHVDHRKQHDARQRDRHGAGPNTSVVVHRGLVCD